jgi:Uma2 family endonuclease
MLSVEQFRRMYVGSKPHFELLSGEAIQKTTPTKAHAVLQFLLCVMLRELGVKSLPELTLAIDESWEPTPDVCGILGPVEDPYPTHAVAVAIEILSPDDRFTRVIQKCRRYAEWGVPDILVFDPTGREAWNWDAITDGLTRVKEAYLFRSKPVELVLADVFQRFEADLQ